MVEATQRFAIVPGAARGIGAAVAERLAHREASTNKPVCVIHRP
jgi:NAD(P)-dependent dehydrogenase (short-subunit alcohol dehydrogenase family)